MTPVGGIVGVGSSAGTKAPRPVIRTAIVTLIAVAALFAGASVCRYPYTCPIGGEA